MDFQVLANREIWICRGGLHEVADRRKARNAILPELPAEYRDPTGAGRDQPQNHPYRRGFPRAVSPQKTVDLACCYAEGQVLNGPDFAVVLREACKLDCRASAGCQVTSHAKLL